MINQTNETMTNFTTLTEMTENFPVLEGKLFTDLFKGIVRAATIQGETFKQANSTAFKILITNDEFCKLLKIS